MTTKRVSYSIRRQGKLMTSEEFASFIEDLLTTQSNDVYFYIGGPEGFSERSRIMHKCEFRCLL